VSVRVDDDKADRASASEGAIYVETFNGRIRKPVENLHRK
jgi:hypothetical protein